MTELRPFETVAENLIWRWLASLNA